MHRTPGRRTAPVALAHGLRTLTRAIWTDSGRDSTVRGPARAAPSSESHRRERYCAFASFRVASVLKWSQFRPMVHFCFVAPSRGSQ